MAGRLPILQSLSLLLPDQNGRGKGSTVKNLINRVVDENCVKKNRAPRKVSVKSKIENHIYTSDCEKDRRRKNGICNPLRAIGLAKSQPAEEETVPGKKKLESENDLNSKTKSGSRSKWKHRKGRKSRKRVRKSQTTPVKASRSKKLENGNHDSRNVNISPEVHISPSKRLSNLIDRLARRTSSDHDNKLPRSPVKRSRPNSILFEEPFPKKLRVDESIHSFDALDTVELEPECSIEVEDGIEMSDAQSSMTLAVARILNLEQEINLLKRRYTWNKIPLNDQTIRIYSGLPNLQIFNAVYENIKPMVLKIRCKREGIPVYRVRWKYRRIFRQFVRAKRLNLKDEFMIAMMHARKYHVSTEDTAKRYGISSVQCQRIVRLWATFLPYELQKAFIRLHSLLPKSKWSSVPEYTPPLERDCTPCSDTSLESTTSDSSVNSKRASLLETFTGGIDLIRHKKSDGPPKRTNCENLRKLITSNSTDTTDHEGFFDFRSNYVCEYCFAFHDSSLDLLDHTKNRFGSEYMKLRSQLENIVEMIEDNSRDAQEWKCCVCSETRDTLSSFLSHLSRHMKNPSPMCSKCYRYFPTKELHDIHCRDHHKKNKTYFCDTCCIVLESEKHLEDHRLKHSNKTMKKLSSSPPKKTPPFFEHNNPKVAIPRIPLKIAPKIIKAPVRIGRKLLPKLEQVVQRSTSTNILTKPVILMKCDKCEESFLELSELEQHRSSHCDSQADDRLRCPYCSRTFAHRVTLKVHLTHHTGEKPHKCSYCDKSFFRKNDLYNHERIHTGEKPYSCQYCGAKFAHSCSLAAHIRQSCSKVPSKCEICGFICKQRNEFEAHMKTHVGEAKFRCNICGKIFLMRQHLEQHRNIHLKKFPCSSCNALFHTQRELDSHVKTHLKNSADPTHSSRGIHKCDVCPKSFTRRSDLKRHKRRIHHIFEALPLKSFLAEEQEVASNRVDGSASEDEDPTESDSSLVIAE